MAKPSRFNSLTRNVTRDVLEHPKDLTKFFSEKEVVDQMNPVGLGSMTGTGMGGPMSAPTYKTVRTEEVDPMSVDAFATGPDALETGLNSALRATPGAVVGTGAFMAGMAGGQAIDLASVGKQLTQNELEQMHRLKTGALLRTAVQIGAIAIHLNDQEKKSLDVFASALGLAFQVVDDVLDASSDSQTLGKTAGKDAAANKPTFVSLMGLDGAREFARQLHQEALDSLSIWGDNADLLRAIASKVVNREN